MKFCLFCILLRAQFSSCCACSSRMVYFLFYYQHILNYIPNTIAYYIFQSGMLSKAVVGGGCFWCVQAVLQRLKGVHKIQSGYAGGKVPNPTYKDICSGKTGHAEVVRVHYDKQILPYYDLLFIFMNLHDPTTLNRQGNDQGTQYRSIIMYETEGEKDTAKKVIEEIQKNYKNNVVTELTKLTEFYPAQEYHQNYYNQNPNQGYCQAVIKPKVKKLESLFEKYLQKGKL